MLNSLTFQETYCIFTPSNNQNKNKMKTAQMPEIVKILIEREELSKQEAKIIYKEMKERVKQGESPDEVLGDYGLEPDYFMDLY